MKELEVNETAVSSLSLLGALLVQEALRHPKKHHVRLVKYQVCLINRYYTIS